MDLAGLTFNRLTVIQRAPKGRKGWLCRCVCGTEKIVVGRHLQTGSTKSCGCWATERMAQRNTTHGLTDTPEWRIWHGIKTRCFNAADHNFPNYGGRGITMCEEWRRFLDRFLADMGQRPSAQHSIDRIDTNGPYAPGNCRWATTSEQQNNRRSNIRVTVDGQSFTLAQAARHHGISPQALHYRLKQGWSLLKALTTEKRKLTRRHHATFTSKISHA